MKRAIPLFLLLFLGCNQPVVHRNDANDAGSTSKTENQDNRNPDFKPPIEIKVSKPTPPQKITKAPKSVSFAAHVAQGICNFTTYTTDEGLALDVISATIMDHSGNLWFGTQGGGASRYDGHSFTNYGTSLGLAHNIVLSLLEDSEDNIWFGTEGGGVSKFDGRIFTKYTVNDGLGNNEVRSIMQDKNQNIWFATSGGGVSRFDGESFKTFTTLDGLPSNDVRCVMQDRDGMIWLATADGGVCTYDNQQSQEIGIEAKLKKHFVSYSVRDGLAFNNVNSILQDKKGNIWFGTYGGGVSCYDGKSFKNYTTKDGLCSNLVRCITEDLKGKIWIGTTDGGASSFDGKTFINYTTAQGLSNNDIRNITKDKAGNLWFGTFGGGISRYDGTLFSNFTTAHGLPNNIVFSITEDKKKNIWFGMDDGGASCFDGITFTNYSNAQGLASNAVNCVTEDDEGNIWFGTYGAGATKYNPLASTMQNYTTQNGLPSNKINYILEDEKKQIWFATEGQGISCFDGKTFKNFTTINGLTSNTVNCITEDKKKNLWFGTNGGGICVYDGNNFNVISKGSGLLNDIVYCILEDQGGNFWFCTEGGLTVLLKQSGKFKTITTREGLPDNVVTQIVEHEKGVFYVGTNLGICQVLESNEECVVNATYNSNGGYPIKDVNVGSHCMMIDSKGIIWISTGSAKTALVRFDPWAVNENLAPPVINFIHVKINNENICWNDLVSAKEEESEKIGFTFNQGAALAEEVTLLGRILNANERQQLYEKFKGVKFTDVSPFYYVPSNLVLPYNHNNITIEFAAIEPSKPNLVKYQFMLMGYDNDWSPVDSKNSASYGNIFEGTYTFKVKTQSLNGNWSKPVEYTFTVLPPWYRTWWAYLLVVLILVSALVLFFRWRTASLRNDKKKLEQIIAERTTEVMASKKLSDDLLLNILPEEVAEELKTKGQSEAKFFDNVTVLFTDFVSFTTISEKLSAKELVAEIHLCFTEFDKIMERHGLEKIKTIGDAYLAICGLPHKNDTHAQNSVRAAIEIIKFVEQREISGGYFKIRIGINSGSVVAGIVGVRKFAYDIWGDAVNTAARMEQNSKNGKINISESTYQLIKDDFKCHHRGKILAKNKGHMDMYFVEV